MLLILIDSDMAVGMVWLLFYFAITMRTWDPSVSKRQGPPIGSTVRAGARPLLGPTELQTIFAKFSIDLTLKAVLHPNDAPMNTQTFCDCGWTCLLFGEPCAGRAGNRGF